MPKTLINLTAVANQFISSLLAGNYSSPSQLTVDQYGRISSITTGSALYTYALNSILGTPGVITVSTSTGTVIVDLSTTTFITTTTTFIPFTGLTRDGYGRVTQVYTGTYVTSGTYNNIIGMQIDTYGQITSITTGTTPTSIPAVNTVTVSTIFNASPSVTIAGTSTNLPAEKYVGFLDSAAGNTRTYTLDLSTGANFVYNFYVANNFNIQFTNVPTYTNRTVAVTFTYQYSSSIGNGYSTQLITFLSTNTISVNGVSSTLKWLNNTLPYSYKATIVLSFNIFYNGSSHTVYASLTPFS